MAQDFSRATPNEYLTATAPIQKVEFRIEALMPEEAMRAALAMEPGIPAWCCTGAPGPSARSRPSPISGTRGRATALRAASEARGCGAAATGATRWHLL